MVSPGLVAILVPYFKKWVFWARFGAGNKSLGVPTEANFANINVTCSKLRKLIIEIYLYSFLPNQGGILTHFVQL